MRISDEKLMMRCRNGDTGAFELIVMRFKDQIINYICRSVGDYHQAEDLAQETFLRILQPTCAETKFGIGIAEKPTCLLKYQLKTRKPII